MKSDKLKNFIKKATVALCIAVCLFSLFLPFPFRFSGGETYRCVWSDGRVTTESYSSAYASLFGMDTDGVILYRKGRLGRISSRSAAVCGVLETGELDELLACSAETGTRIERAALYRAYAKRIWYDGEFFVWNGSGVERRSKATGDELVLLDGGISARKLQDTGVTTLVLRAGARITREALSAACLKTVCALPPYHAADGAVYLSTAGGKRLIGALVAVKTLTLDADLSFADEGALLYCRELESLALPFAGSAADDAGSAYRGELAHLFSDGKEYNVPPSLKRVRITGGALGSDAFYACENLCEIDACGVAEEKISASAFDGLPSLRFLHSPKKVCLQGFSVSSADCGCTVYERIA